jgi:hypothetical protein
MFQIEADLIAQVVHLTYSGDVDEDEMRRCVVEIRPVVAGMNPGFRLLTDLSGLRSMDFACAPHVGDIMNLCNEKKIGMVVRVIPDPGKDIGYSILSHFHYGPEVALKTFETLKDALQSL